MEVCLVGLLLLFSNRRNLNMSLRCEGWQLAEKGETGGMRSEASTGESKGILGSHVEPGNISKHNSVVPDPFGMDYDIPYHP